MIGNDQQGGPILFVGECIFCPTNIPGAITLPPALAFSAFGIKSIRRLSDID